MNCGTCKHFKEDPPAKSRVTEGFGHCGRIRQYDSYDEAETSKEPAITEDGSDYYSALLCREDFGCVLHEPKPGTGGFPAYNGCLCPCHSLKGLGFVHTYACCRPDIAPATPPNAAVTAATKEPFSATPYANKHACLLPPTMEDGQVWTCPDCAMRWRGDDCSVRAISPAPLGNGKIDGFTITEYPPHDDNHAH